MSQNTNTLAAWKATCTGAQDLLTLYASVPTVPYPRKSPKTYLSFNIEPFAKNMHHVIHCLGVLHCYSTWLQMVLYQYSSHIYYFGI